LLPISFIEISLNSASSRLLLFDSILFEKYKTIFGDNTGTEAEAYK
jgi:hypothetical protein